MKHFIRVFSVVSLLALFIVLPACNTTKGVGKDIEKAGEGLKNSADKHGAD